MAEGRRSRSNCSSLHPPRILYCLANPDWLSQGYSRPCYPYNYGYMASDYTITKRGLGYNISMKKLIAFLAGIALALSLTSCGDGGFRYPCQDSANWEKAECNPPICETTGTCSKDLVGQEVWDEYQKTKGNNG